MLFELRNHVTLLLGFFANETSSLPSKSRLNNASHNSFSVPFGKISIGSFSCCKIFGLWTFLVFDQTRLGTMVKVGAGVDSILSVRR